MGRRNPLAAPGRGRARAPAWALALALLSVLVLLVTTTAAAAEASSSPPPSLPRRRRTAVVDGISITGYVAPPLSVAAAEEGQLLPSPDAADASASSASSSSLPSAMDPLYAQSVADHNAYRQKHRAPALTWDDAVASRAKVTVDSCVFQHNAQGDGENIAYTSNLDQAAALAWAVKVRNGQTERERERAATENAEWGRV